MMFYIKDLPEFAQHQMLDYIERINVSGFVFRDEMGYIFIRKVRT